MKIIAIILCFFSMQANAANSLYRSTWSNFSSGTFLTDTAIGSSTSGYWTTAYQGLSGPSPSWIQTGAFSGLSAKLDAANGWVSSGNSRTAYTTCRFSARIKQGDQAWIHVRWNGTYTGFLPTASYAVQFSGTNSYSFLEQSGGGQIVKASGTVTRTNTDFTARIDAIGNTMTLFVNDNQIASFWDNTLTSGGIALTSSFNQSSYFDALVVDDAASGVTIPSGWTTLTGVTRAK